METILKGKKVAILATDGFEQSELETPLKELKNAGATVEIVSLKKGKIKGWKENNWGEEIEVDKILDEVKSDEYDALVLPGGALNPDTLRSNEDAVNFAADFLEEGKPLAAICHGPWTLIESGLLQGRRMTSYKSIRTDMINAGVSWVDEEVVVDNGLVTSRSPKDLPAFCKKMIEEIKEGVHE
jgi:protease I